MTIEIGNDVLDSREVNGRIEELKELVEDGEWTEDGLYLVDGEDYTGEKEELSLWEDLKEEFVDYIPDWEWGSTLILSSYFPEYTKKLASDCFGIRNEEWPFRHINWEDASEELKQDYTEVSVVDTNGVVYTYLSQ